MENHEQPKVANNTPDTHHVEVINVVYKVSLDCHQCGKTNDLAISKHINCVFCNSELTGKVYVKSKTFKMVILGALLAIGGGEVLDYRETGSFSLPNDVKKYIMGTSSYPYRFSVATEFAIIDQCVHSNNSHRFSQYQLQQKRDLCLCALEEAEKQGDSNNFRRNFREATNHCG